MGLFSGIKNTFKKSEAAVVVQNLLEETKRVGFFDSDPARVANRLVESAWDSRPDIFGGAYGDRPHKVTFAAYSFAYAIGNLRRDSPARDALVIPFGKLMLYLQKTGHLFSFNRLDNELLGAALCVFEELMAEEMAENPLPFDIGLDDLTSAVECAEPQRVTAPPEPQKTWSAMTAQACINKLFEEGYQPEAVGLGFEVRRTGEKPRFFATREELNAFLEGTFGSPD